MIDLLDDLLDDLLCTSEFFFSVVECLVAFLMLLCSAVVNRKRKRCSIGTPLFYEEVGIP